MSNLSIFKNGLIKENPVLRLVLGTCPTLAVTTAAINGLGMGAAATFVLLGSNITISLLRNVIPDKVRIPAYITIIAGFVTIVQMICKAFLPSINDALGIYLPLIVVNCIILGRAEMFARKNTVAASIFDALGMGIGFTAALLAMGIIRELLGAGTLFGMQVFPSFMPAMTLLILPPGGFFVFGVLIALANKLSGKLDRKSEAMEQNGDSACGDCAACGACAGKEGCEQ